MKSPSPANCGGAAVGIVPLAGDYAKVVVRRGDKSVEAIVRQSDNKVIARITKDADGTAKLKTKNAIDNPSIYGGSNVRPISARDANSTHELPPYASNRPIYEFDADGSTQYVRVYTEGTTGQAGSWMMRQSDISGLTPRQIHNRFDLPHTPTHVTDVIPPQGTVIRSGTVSSGNFGGAGGGTQFQLMDRIPGSAFSNPRPLE